jgi:hypothetical protein
MAHRDLENPGASRRATLLRQRRLDNGRYPALIHSISRLPTRWRHLRHWRTPVRSQTCTRPESLIRKSRTSLSNADDQKHQHNEQFWFFCELFYVLSTSLLKVSIGLFLLRVATKPLHLWIIRAVMLFSAVFGSAFAFVVIFQCWPIANWWSLNPAEKHCINPTIIITLTYAISAVNVIADWTIGIIPIFIVQDLQMSTRQRRLVAAILGFAALGSTATIVRLPYIKSLKGSFLGWNGDFLCKFLCSAHDARDHGLTCVLRRHSRPSNLDHSRSRRWHQRRLPRHSPPSPPHSPRPSRNWQQQRSSEDTDLRSQAEEPT